VLVPTNLHPVPVFESKSRVRPALAQCFSGAFRDDLKNLSRAQHDRHRRTNPFNSRFLQRAILSANLNAGSPVDPVQGGVLAVSRSISRRDLNRSGILPHAEDLPFRLVVHDHHGIRACNTIRLTGKSSAHRPSHGNKQSSNSAPPVTPLRQPWRRRFPNRLSESWRRATNLHALMRFRVRRRTETTVA